MEPHSTPPQWLDVLGWISLIAAFASAAYILYDIYINRYRQKMTIMEVVYPTTALYLGPAAVWFYRKYGRRKSTKLTTRHPERPDERSGGHNRHQHHTGSGETSLSGEEGLPRVSWDQTAEAVTHCGAGCTLGDIVAEWSVLALGITIAGTALYADIVFDFVLAWLLGIIFQYFTIVPMRELRPLQGIKEAIKADTLSIIAFQIGLFAGMIIYQLFLFSNPLPKTTATYWFLMQLSMTLGFFTAYPVNRWLIRRGVKEAM
ncbi:membrane protein [Microlunatus endophyticus]|uniref:Membrane protein n=1 Tax=Microlunatus endophyticus TaxID=1716077 RepID=A0A917SHU4_9ACTN|nr:DUF4396 domain-containing protein [Microlunatus endophyticus]GGL79667.1 membrane protein [Microlunatus endophyticus]